MRVFLLVTASVLLAGCSSTSMPSMDFFKSKPVEVALQLESTPPGATATTSLGPSCKTPCSVSVAASENFSVTYGLAKYQTATVPVTVTTQMGSPPVLDPNPAVAELQPLTPTRKTASKKRAAKPKAAAPDSDDSSPFPPPPPAQ
ncbi:MAG: hypothetical protein EKK40_10615 [Bradyrhizobiaceae bacterium]|nr:MAG: hypothetical protein EKK40_10615 [Bradyrhizobiaceae bacterium]